MFNTQVMLVHLLLLSMEKTYIQSVQCFPLWINCVYKHCCWCPSEHVFSLVVHLWIGVGGQIIFQCKYFPYLPDSCILQSPNDMSKHVASRELCPTIINNGVKTILYSKQKHGQHLHINLIPPSVFPL